VDCAKDRRRSGNRDDFERSQPASQLARFGGDGVAFQRPLSFASVGMGVRFGVGSAKTRCRNGVRAPEWVLGLLKSPFVSVHDDSATATKVVIGILISVEDSVWIVRSRN
jgi:hypothetical protein